MKKNFPLSAAMHIACVSFFLLCSSLLHTVKAQDLLFAKHFANTTPLGGNLEGKGIAVDAAGNRYVTGYFQNTADLDPGAGTRHLTAAGDNDIFLAKYDASGNYVWALRAGSAGNINQGLAVAVDAAGNSYITGTLSGTVDFDPGTGTQNFSSAGSTDIFLAKYDASGNYVWAGRMGGAGTDAGTAVALDASGNSLVTGYFAGTVDFDPGAGTQDLTAASGSYDVFLGKYDASGNYVWAKNTVSSTGSDQGFALAVDASGNSYITGDFSGTADFDPDAATQTLTAIGSIDIYLAKYDAAGNYVWAKGMGGTTAEMGYAVAVDAAGNSYITGTFAGTVDFDPGAATQHLTPTGNYDIFLAKYDAAGNYVWAHNVGGISADEGRALKVDAAGNSYVTGNFSYTADFDPGAGTQNLVSANNSYDIFLAKYDASGNYLWAKGMGGTSADIGYGLAIDASANSFITGSFQGSTDLDPGAGTASLTAGGSAKNGYILHLNGTGDYALASGLGGGYSNGSFVEEGRGIKVDASGNSYVTGYFTGTVDFDAGAGTQTLTSAGNMDIFLAKYDVSGNYIWAIRVGSTSTDAANAIAIDASGNSYITGYYNGTVDFDPGAGTQTLTSISSSDIFLAKYDAAGNLIWAKSMGGNSSADEGKGVAVDALGNSYITGEFLGTADFDPGAGTVTLTSNFNSNDMFLAKYDAAGNYVWAMVIGGTGGDHGYNVAVDASGNSYVTGYFNGTADFDAGAGTQNLTSAGGSRDIFLAKYDAAGNYVWAKSMGGTGQDLPYALAIDASGNSYIAGYFTSTVDFDPGAGIQTLSSAGSLDIFLAKYDASGNYVWAKSIGGTSFDETFALDVDALGNSYITGIYSGTVDFDPGAGTQTLSSSGAADDIFLAKYDASGNYVWAKSIGGENNDVANALALDASGNAYITGLFGGTADFDPGTATQNLTAINGSDLYLAKFGPATPLPIRLESFAGQLVDNGAAVLMQWTTAAQDNFAYFEIERSPDGKNITTLGQVAGCGTCNERQQYNVTDHQPLNGKAYYRLKMVDMDGKAEYSTWITINKNAALQPVVFYPTITTGAAKASYYVAGADRKIRISIFDAQGKIVQQSHVMLTNGSNQLHIDLSARAKGLYYVQLTEQNGKVLGISTVIRK